MCVSGEWTCRQQLNKIVTSSVFWSPLGQNFKNPKKTLGQSLKSQVKKEFPFPCIPILKNL